MKRYEKMSKEEIMSYMHEDLSLKSDDKLKYLYQEIRMKPRHEIYKTPEEADKGFRKFCESFLHCRNCEYGSLTIPCVLRWLYDSEEVCEYSEIINRFKETEEALRKGVTVILEPDESDPIAQAQKSMENAAQESAKKFLTLDLDSVSELEKALAKAGQAAYSFGSGFNDISKSMEGVKE